MRFFLLVLGNRTLFNLSLMTLHKSFTDEPTPDPSIFYEFFRLLRYISKVQPPN